MATLLAAQQLVERLAQRRLRIVFAESCTGGLIAAELAKVPGVSEWLCGSAVTYRCETKTRWLGVSQADIRAHTAVSSQVAIQMAQGVLAKTPEAALAASITGHLGPGAPAELDGVLFIGIAMRNAAGEPNLECTRHQLVNTLRQQRQAEAAELVMQRVLQRL